MSQNPDQEPDAAIHEAATAVEEAYDRLGDILGDLRRAIAARQEGDS